MMSEVKIAHLYALILERWLFAAARLYSLVCFFEYCVNVNHCRIQTSSFFSIFKTDAYVDTI